MTAASTSTTSATAEATTIEYNKTVLCRRCGMEITFSNAIMGRTKKKVPLDVNTHKPHDCVEFVRECRYCEKTITFSNETVSKKGRKIPLDAATLKPHIYDKKKANETPKEKIN